MRSMVAEVTRASFNSSMWSNGVRCPPTSRRISPPCMATHAPLRRSPAITSMSAASIRGGSATSDTVEPSTRSRASVVVAHIVPWASTRSARTPRIAIRVSSGCHNPATRENLMRPSAVPAQMRLSSAAAIVPTMPRPVHGVMRCGTRRSTPSVVPAQILPSRSSKTERTASLDRPDSTVVFSIVARAGSVSACLTRQRPCPMVADPQVADAIVQHAIAAAGLGVARRDRAVADGPEPEQRIAHPDPAREVFADAQHTHRIVRRLDLLEFFFGGFRPPGTSRRRCRSTTCGNCPRRRSSRRPRAVRLRRQFLPAVLFQPEQPAAAGDPDRVRAGPLQSR